MQAILATCSIIVELRHFAPSGIFAALGGGGKIMKSYYGEHYETIAFLEL